ncbi:MAG TPA: hypothetical protein VF982_03065 [Anaerolineales bacterium]
MAGSRLLFQTALVLVALPLLPPVSGTDILGEMDAAQQVQLRNGSQVFITEDVDGKPWPRITVFQAVTASPEEVMAVFFDYESARTFEREVRNLRLAIKEEALAQK